MRKTQNQVRQANEPVEPGVVTGSRDPSRIQHAVDPDGLKDPGNADPDPAPAVPADPPDPTRAASDPPATPSVPAADPNQAHGGAAQGGSSNGQGGTATVHLHQHQASDLQQLHEATRDLRSTVDSHTEKVDRINSAMDALEDRINKRIDEQRAAQVRASQPATGQAADRNSPESREVRRAFCNLLITVAGQGDVNTANTTYQAALRSAGHERQADLLIGENPRGGYVAPPEFRMELVRLVQEMSPMLDLVTSETIDAPEFVRPRENALPTAVWAGERSTRNVDNFSPFASEAIPMHELDAMVDVSWRSLRMAFLDLDGWLMRAFATQFARSMGYKIIDGTGVQQPQGVLNSDAMTKVAAGSTTGGIDADGLIDAAHHLVEDYADMSTWVFKRSTIGAIRKFKTDDAGDYIWQPAFTDGNPATIVDRPYRASDAFPALTTSQVTCGALASWMELYTVVMNSEIDYLVDPYSRRNFGDIRFSARQLCGGGLMQPAAGILIQSGA